MKKLLVMSVLVLLAGSVPSACGQTSDEPTPTTETVAEQDSDEETLRKIVVATCTDLRNASTQADAARTLSYAMQLAESIGVSNTQLGSYLSANCQDAINNANMLP